MAYEFSLENVATFTVAVVAAVVYLETKFSKMASKEDLDKVKVDIVNVNSNVSKFQVDVTEKIGGLKTDIEGIKHDVLGINDRLTEHIILSDKKHENTEKELKMFGSTLQKHNAAIKGLQSITPPRPRKVVNRQPDIDNTPEVSEDMNFNR